MDFCLDRLGEGHWLHIYPEGRVNADGQTKALLPLKWGVGRLVVESPVVPIVVPIYHLGMDKVLPNKKPYVPRINQRVTICIGEPIELKQVLADLEARKASDEDKRKTVTDLIRSHMLKLRAETEIHHAKHTFVL